jgi:hypothetical protein
MGPDGKPWDPERKTKRDAERAAPAGEGAPATVGLAQAAAETAVSSEE